MTRQSNTSGNETKFVEQPTRCQTTARYEVGYGRRCYGVEIDALYVDTAIRRWQQYTGIEAIHVATNKNFAQLEAERTATLGYEARRFGV